MQFGVQFNGNVPGNATRRWSTHRWSEAFNVIWEMVPTNPAGSGPAQLEWKVQNMRQPGSLVTWFIEVKNLTGVPVDFQARYAILNA